MKYVDGFVLVVAKRAGGLPEARPQGAAVWKEYGALEYVECAVTTLT